MNTFWFSLALALITLLSGCSDPPPRQFAALPEEAVVLVVGDSLVAGTGASRDDAWPAQLARSTGWTVVNAGVPGATSSDALARLPDLLDAHRPDAVIIAIGGNDFLRSVPLETTRNNITALVATSQASTGHVALVAIPAMSVGGALIGRLSDHELYAAIATSHELVLVQSVVSETLSKAEMRSDRIHANTVGYAHIAEGVIETLSRHGWRLR